MKSSWRKNLVNRISFRNSFINLFGSIFNYIASLVAHLVKNLPVMWGSIPGLGRSPREGKGYPLQYSSLENFMDCIVHGVAKSRTWLSDFHWYFQNLPWYLKVEDTHSVWNYDDDLGKRASPVVLVVKNLPSNSGNIRDAFQSLGQEFPLEKK